MDERDLRWVATVLSPPIALETRAITDQSRRQLPQMQRREMKSSSTGSSRLGGPSVCCPAIADLQLPSSWETPGIIAVTAPHRAPLSIPPENPALCLVSSPPSLDCPNLHRQLLTSSCQQNYPEFSLTSPLCSLRRTSYNLSQLVIFYINKLFFRPTFDTPPSHYYYDSNRKHGCH